MQRGNKILLAGIIILVSSAIIFGLSAYKAILMIENFPDISAKGLADKATEKLAGKVTDRINASAKIPDRLADRVTASVNAFLNTSTDTEDVSTQNIKQKLMIDAGILFFAIVSGIVLLINGLLAMIIGIYIWVHDRRHEA
ncbi:hypothetical protein NMY3_02076 [Candidatus Nitrosocosmicus oleophilus]|uniref:Uncharacterized protein n=1 Tax=Candidatus Nitrosocosmicus oleophilus TaxID=1353260 RepID=A0A654LZ61_9ARCH|nr:hypothetical protein [Candidatus Nitrosocosmicus oleophilus]ALI36277.1 hypothetical protein NMY3_02076 [Candidatus Nitrosocosmicus oleophilus]